MDVTTVSQKFQVVIPRRILQQFGIIPGQRLQVIVLAGRIELVPTGLRRNSGRGHAVRQVVDLDSQLPLAAAQLSHALQLPMAHSITLAKARDRQARLHTMDSDFRGIADVEWQESIP
jgi:AbrB family looped-hinge helix DNA binding protein